jgi:hypothetical protein
MVAAKAPGRTSFRVVNPIPLVGSGRWRGVSSVRLCLPLSGEFLELLDNQESM